VTTFPEKLSGSEVRGLMRTHRITIRELAQRTGITMKRIRQVREIGIDHAAAARDWYEAITAVPTTPEVATSPTLGNPEGY
jgi:hypothetical protein